MTTLYVDSGNTNVKWRMGEVEEVFTSPSNSPKLFDWILGNRAKLEFVAVSSVQTDKWNLELQQFCKQQELELWFASSPAEAQGLQSAYSSAEQLGVDRWLALLALWCRFRKGFLLVDSGTAITLDVVDNQGQHLGGFILPGLALQRATLMQASENLAALVKTTPTYSSSLGKNTAEAIDHGVIASAVALIEKQLRLTDCPEERLIFAGGGAGALRDEVGAGILVEGLVLQGLSLAWDRHRALEENNES